MKQAKDIGEKELLDKIKQKKELSGLADSVVETSINGYLRRFKINLSSLSPKEKKLVIKEIRLELRKLTGRFQKGLKNRSKLLEEDAQKLLRTHSSTSERIEFYPELKKIVSLTKAKSILDLGCGLNPIALADKKTRYYASDIKEDELSLIKRFFKNNGIKGETFVYDLREIKGDLPRIDLCIIFKVLDIITPGSKRKETVKKILQKVKCKHFLISFATKKLSGKKMNRPKRFWFEKILNNADLNFQTFEAPNEIFYLIKRLKSR